MKLSMMSYTMSHRAERFGVAEVREMFELSRELGLDGIDFVRIYDIDPRELRRMADDYGVPVVCHTFFADLSPDSEQGRRAGIDVAKRGIENAVLLNTRTVMIPPVGRTEMPREICARNVIAALQEARREAERLHGPLTKPPFLVTDNGCSFVARRFASHVKDLFTHVRIQYRTPTQLGLLERFHRTLKEEEIYWRMYDNPVHARECIAEFRHRYNMLRPHWALVPEEGGDPVTPHEVYVEGISTGIPRWQAWARAAKAKLEQMMLEAVA